MPSLERPALAPIALVAAMPVVTVPAPIVIRLAGAALRAGPPGHVDTLKLRC